MSLNGLKEILLASNPEGSTPETGYIYKWVEKENESYVYKYKNELNEVGYITLTTSNIGNQPNFRNVAVDYQMIPLDRILLCNGELSITLPSISTEIELDIKNIGTNTITIKTPHSELIDGSNELIITKQYDSVTLVFDGTNWWVI